LERSRLAALVSGIGGLGNGVRCQSG
jgi:hypothetical protein